MQKNSQNVILTCNVIVPYKYSLSGIKLLDGNSTIHKGDGYQTLLMH